MRRYLLSWVTLGVLVWIIINLALILANGGTLLIKEDNVAVIVFELLLLSILTILTIIEIVSQTRRNGSSSKK
uniref:Uncharacterized protein n=1 Tax=viral metagenome TaxID=1070528 RepID=A0A6M3JPU7_9ZZZZ